MKKAAYVMFILQLLSLYGGVSEYGASFLGALLSSGFSYLVGYFFPTILGIIFLIRHGKNQEKEYAIYYCDTCKETRPHEGGKKLTCLNCRSALRELPVLASEWDKLSDQEQEKYKQQLPQIPRQKNPEPEARKPVRPVRDLPTAGRLPLGQYFPEYGAHNPDGIYYDASEHAVMKLVHFQADGMSVCGYSTIRIPAEIQTLSALLTYLRQAEKKEEPPRLRLYWQARGKELEISQNPVLVGRQTDCTLTFGDTDWQKHLSRQHARFTFRDGEWYLEDLGSMNGTLVNGKRIAPNNPVRLYGGDTIQFSQSDIFCFDSASRTILLQ